MTINELAKMIRLLLDESNRLWILMWPGESPTVNALFRERATARGRLNREREFWINEHKELTRYVYPVVGHGGYW